MRIYKEKINSEVEEWKVSIQTPQPISYSGIKRLQRKINKMTPHRVHELITNTVKQITRGVLSGVEYTTSKPATTLAIHNAEDIIRETIWFYASSAAAQGAFTGLGGIFSSIADFPLWMSIKMKMLFEIAGHYGFDTQDYKERLFILHVFQLSFASPSRRPRLLKLIENWEQSSEELPSNIHDFDWKKFQLEYRDNLDISKVFQLIPGIGAIIGGCVNHKLTYRLGKTAMMAYRIRVLQNEQCALRN
ncbi:EcsC family protein [Reichenbachiella ulvae]|uniref:EcsC family protein n=1 Tax=Reichenbachiella ulvae TaxID=2980104 RepID=A0ABT3CYT8_9BACT|nr:EcsC family protein [Reichenbachiella ulvae]MCV9388866.1 EcsC family protein [Reichenbachiella ulvae]